MSASRNKVIVVTGASSGIEASEAHIAPSGHMAPAPGMCQCKDGDTIFTSTPLCCLVTPSFRRAPGTLKYGRRMRRPYYALSARTGLAQNRFGAESVWRRTGLAARIILAHAQLFHLAS